MNRAAIILALLMAIPICPAHAKTRFFAYEGRDSIVEGRGGTRISKNEIDYWTSGTPPRRFQVIGFIDDSRGTGALHGDVVGSRSIARLAKAAGGQAVIILDSSTETVGLWGSSNSYSGQGQTTGNGIVTAIRRRHTKIAVIRYLD